MNSRTRFVVMSITAPVVVFAIVGGFLGRVMAEDSTFRHLKVFDDVVGMITSSYVEQVNIDKVMSGAMRGLAEGLDPDSAYLSPQEVKQAEGTASLPPAEIGLDLTKQYYLRVVAARDNSPAAKAGLRTGDYVRSIDGQPTREMSVWHGMRLLRGAPGSKVKLTVIRGNAADPHDIELTREAVNGPDVTSRVAAPSVGYVRIAAIGSKTADQVKKAVADLTKGGATSLVVDVRRTAGGPIEDGVAIARLFVDKGTLAVREGKGADKQTLTAAAGDGAIRQPAVVLIDTGTSGASEVFAAALAGNKRADLVGERTIGRAAIQRLIKLPDGSGLWLSTARYLTPGGVTLHEKGLEPSIVVDEPDVEFGQPAPTTDVTLEKAIAELKKRA